MRRGFYSAAARNTTGTAPAATEQLRDTPKTDVTETRTRTWRALYKRHERPLIFGAGAIAAVTFLALHGSFTPAAPVLTQDDIDQAVMRTLETKPVPSPAVA